MEEKFGLCTVYYMVNNYGDRIYFIEIENKTLLFNWWCLQQDFWLEWKLLLFFFFQFTELLFLRLITLSDATRQMESVGGNETNKTTQHQRRR